MADSNLFSLPSRQPNKLQNFGEALQGIGAAFQGRDIQFEEARKLARTEAEKKRLTAMVKDAKQAYDFINRGDVNNAMSLIQDRVQMINELGGDPSDTARIGSMLESGRIAEAQNELRGFLRPFMPTEAIKASELTDSGQRVTFDPLTGQATAEDVAGFRAKPEDSKVFEDESKLRTEFNSLQSVKDFAIRNSALGAIEASAQDPTAAGDISLIFAYMKMLDPNSVVREGEFATAQSAGSVPQTLWSKYNQALTGERLAPDVRNDFVNRANKLYTRAAEDFGKVYTRYEDIAKANNLDPARALVDYRFKPASAEIPQSAVSAGITPDVWSEMTPEERALFN